MATVELRYDPKDSAWFTANATMVLKAGEPAYHSVTGKFKLGDGVTQLQNLEFLNNETQLVTATVVNNTGVNLLASNYQAVKVSTAQGQRLAVDFAQANNDNNSADTIGIVRQNINNNQEGEVVILGTISEVNTTGSLQGETWADGDILYLSPTVAGRITKVKPNGLTGHMVVIGYVEYAHANHGKIYVKIQNGYELEELHNTADVTYSTPIDADSLLIKDSTASLWKRLTWANLKTAVKNFFINSSNDVTEVVQIGAANSNIIIGNLNLGISNYPSFWAFQTPASISSTNYFFQGGTDRTFFNSPGYLAFRSQNVNLFQIYPSQTSGAVVNYQFSTPVNTGLTASTNIPSFRVSGANKQWSSGTLTTQYFNHFTANTVAFTTASTATDVFNTFIEAPIAGTNATITNAYSLGTNGKAKFGGNIELTQTVTTETVTSDTTVTIKINGVNYKLLAKS